MAKWYFQEHDGFSDIDQSSSSEAFSGTSIRDLSTALIREGVQNTLDAQSTRKDAGPLVLRLTLGRCASPAASRRWCGELMEHLHQPDVGAPDAPNRDEQCRYLVFEDFGTRGLVGDYSAPYEPGQENNFVNFMYHDGVSGKNDAKLGSRGVGKIVLTMASRARTIFAYTIREDDPNLPLLVGKNLLKFRKLRGRRYAGRSYFLEAWPPHQARRPVTEARVLNQFRNDFPISRSTEPGLSIVIPYLDPSVTGAQLRRALIEQYHFALLAGRLQVEIDDEGRKETLDSRNVPEIDDDEVNARVALARWAVQHPEPQLETLAPVPDQVQSVTEAVVPEHVRKALVASLEGRERVAVRMPLYIHPRNSAPVLTHLDLYMEFADRHRAKPEFIRDLLPVSDVRDARSAPQVRALVLIRPGPLADFLRAAEGANHTDWSPRTEKFQETYIGRRGEIVFVAQSVSRLVEIARGQASEPVGGIATQFFSIAQPDQKKAPRTRTVKPGPDPEQPPDDLEPTRPSSFILTQTKDGFSIKHNSGQPLASRLTVRIAYDVVRGSPWSQYDPADFDLRKTRGHIRITPYYADLRRKDPGNQLVIMPESELFEVTVMGFDPNRDLIVDVREPERQKRRRKENVGAN